MRLSIGTGLLAATSVHAFSDSSPFLLFSTSQFASQPNNDQLQTSSRVLSSVKDLLASCPTKHYLLVSQPNVHATDLRGTHHEGCQSPNLCRILEDLKTDGTQFSVAETMGSFSFDDFSDYIQATCMERGKQVSVDEHQLKALPSSSHPTERADVLGDNDHEIGQLLQKAQSDGNDYTFIYFSNPNEFKPYEAEFQDPVHLELKRQTGDQFLERRAGNGTVDRRPLFEKYQFFTPGIFMGFMALFIMLSIAYVGLSALGSLQVSYGAFEKDMGPAAHKKQ